jgi:Transcriptional Coactivator p15 (PC4)
VWRSQNQAPESQAPPRNNGELLATIPRGQGEEMRVSIDQFEGRPYVSLRVWAIGQDGNWWPTKKGCSVRTRELSEVAQALMRASDLLNGPPSRPSRPALPQPGGSLASNSYRGRNPNIDDE